VTIAAIDTYRAVAQTIFRQANRRFTRVILQPPMQDKSILLMAYDTINLQTAKGAPMAEGINRLKHTGFTATVRANQKIKTRRESKIGVFNITKIFDQQTLVDGRFPDYRRVLPKNPDKHLDAGCDLLKQAFARAAILSNEKFRGVRLYVSENQLKITANNPEQEEAEEILDVSYNGTEMEIGFNVSYVLDVLNALKCENVRILLTDSVSSVQIEDAASQSAAYVVMPMRL